MAAVNDLNDRETRTPAIRTAVLDQAHLGDIHGALGSIARDDVAPRATFLARLKTLLAIVGPGLIVMVGDNDAGAFGTYTQAGQNYGTTLLWTLMLLIPVLYVNQEMVVRPCAVTGVGHARLIFERFGKFWGAFSVIDLLLLNALTIVTEFIGITLALSYLGLSRFWGVLASAAIVMIAVSTGNFRRFERFSIALVAGSLLLVPVVLMVHPPMGQIATDFLVPKMPEGAKLSEVMLLIVAIVGTTVAPWQLFFQQSYIVDKRITPRFIRYERMDLCIGIVLVVVGAVAMISFCAEIFAGRPEFGNYTDALGIAVGLEKYAGRLPAVLFALALLDACIIGAAAVSLATAYAIGDVFAVKHSLHRKPWDAKSVYGVYCGLIVLAAVLVLTPGTPLGLLTNAVQTLAGVLLPSATVFLLLLCNDRHILGPWVNSTRLNLFTGAVIAALVMLSVILTAAVLFPDLGEEWILGILIGGSLLALVLTAAVKLYEMSSRRNAVFRFKPYQLRLSRNSWRMPPLDQLPKARLGALSRIWMIVLRGYLVVAAGLVLLRIVQLATVGA
ncbi:MULTISPECIES: Nramp family divalent metal transporter [unclassified Bradyrhizobium]|uniref:Nramp family divalent metal transporter n=1 Tax=unclassified Bradyrhizobium TaxID=2631580 RepID=UPI0024792F0B|nr:MULTISPECIES: Nramp family divalent metal transporter [unclassified Bradyrhizobium]WGS21479.1 Nramp family divalent metal transporter [Bradyrhizobium sp. ISRA463]WGS28415.1 Nramp family divalent metal transporter [Bradyrhizobium sp. ISRA464]